MAEAIGASGGSSSLLDAQAGRLLERSRSTQAGSGTGQDPKLDAKIEKSSRDFESILLGSWLQGAEQSFGTVPGGDGEDDEDTGKEQFQGIATQALAGSLAASGGIGIAAMISKSLHAASHNQAPGAPEAAAKEASPQVD